jgi:hypothetical protein
MTPVTCDENGFVRGFPHQDGRLDGILTDDVAKEAHLAIRSVDGERRCSRCAASSPCMSKASARETSYRACAC